VSNPFKVLIVVAVVIAIVAAAGFVYVYFGHNTFRNAEGAPSTTSIEAA
jgi:hypothetical protein